MRPDVSIIIVNLNGCGLLEACLRSIYHHTTGVGFEIIVVDNHSSDGSVAMVKAQYPDARLIENPQNHRYAIANNQGLEIAQGRYVLYLNADTELLGNVVRDMTAFLDAAPDAGGAGCPLVYADGRPQDSCFRFPSALNLFYLNTFARFYWRTPLAGTYPLRDTSAPQRVDFLVGACYMARRELLRQCGGMDDAFYLYGEDSDLCYRIRQAGYVNYYLPSAATVLHHGGAASVEFFDHDQRVRHIQGWKARFQFVGKHYPVWRKIASASAMLLSVGLNLALYALAALKRRNWRYFRNHAALHLHILRELKNLW